MTMASEIEWLEKQQARALKATRSNIDVKNVSTDANQFFYV